MQRKLLLFMLLFPLTALAYVRYDNIYVTNTIGVGTGTAAAPSLYFSTATTSGVFGSVNNHIAIATSGTDRMHINPSGLVGVGTPTPAVSLDIGTKTDSVRLPSGTTALRPSGVNGDIRYNTTTSALEGFVAGAWASIGTGPPGGGSGTVTSVDMSVPSFLTVSGNPITTSGTLAVALAATQIQNTVFAGSAAAGTGIPTFRALVSADIPNLDFAKITTGIVPPAQGGTGAGAFTQGSNVFVDGAGVYAQDNANHFWDDINDFLGLQTNVPTRIIGIGGAGAENIGMETNPTALSAGNSLTVNAGGASSGTNLTGGALILASGVSTGTAISQIQFQIPTPSASGTGANALTSVVTVGTGFATFSSGMGIRVGTGTLTAPTLSFAGDSDTGFFDDSTDNRFTLVAGGLTLFTLGGGGSSIVSSTIGGGSMKAANSALATPTFSFAGDTTTGIHRVGAGTMSAVTLGTERMRFEPLGGTSGKISFGVIPNPAGSDLHLNLNTATAGAFKITNGTTTGTASTDGWEFGLDTSGNGELRQRENLDIIFVTNGTEALRIEQSNAYTLPTTITAGGTTGDRTINKVSGTVNFAAAASTITVTNAFSTTSSIILTNVRTNDATCTIKNVVPGAGSFVITMSANCTAETSVGFFIFN